ncbi:winged helix-turn-helix transcriptional regulator [Dyella acidiphila]|uniref:Helix-turn-helix transcriptional regulator n=1 Tax=Dyella acidiphila TaxID=2775866 RepID=A0ABR9GA29_9GAMM|nr:helix-turn-helix domain-containing protein [Dyella acidiphila]MBE1160904.1 helix-turn-helix transcriptional regulator [Dyella acidiphila]
MVVTDAPPQPGIHPGCQRVIEIFGRLGDKWTILSILMLTEKPRRFNELKRLIGGISQQMLTRTLKALERDGMLTRTVYPTVPPQVEYALTPLGRSLSEPLLQLASWTLEHVGDIEDHRVAHDGKKATGEERGG